MADPTPNEAQQTLIDSTDGIHLVDAGAGTGKTFAITRRYAAIVDQPGVEPTDVLLVTFTRSAATEMKERIVDHSTYSLGELADASIQTFHAHCLDVLQERGHRAPHHLGLDGRITQTTQLVEEDIVRDERFREFFDAFRDDHPEYAEFYRVLEDGNDLQAVIEQFAAKGIIPTADGWYRDSATAIDGDYGAFKQAFDAVNQPRNDGRKQSELRSKLGSYGRNKTYLPDAPAKSTLRGDGTKRVPEATARRAFEEDRDELIDFVHDVYVAYLEFALSRNYLTFGLLQVFAFVCLCEDPALRDAAAFEYVMVDEFQDTSEIQFKLALLLADTDNLCVVGDWKQSIFSFQYAAVANIRAFEDRLERFAAALNDDHKRIQFPVDDVTRIELTENYRSTQDLLDFSEEALVTPATDGEAVDASVRDEIVSLSSNATLQDSRIAGHSHDEEHEAVLATIQEIVDNDDYLITEDGDSRRPGYGDIAVFTRTRDYGRELLAAADAYDLPMAYDGGVELFRTDQAKLLLAWLRILESDAHRGWAVVLEEAGYTLDEIREMLATDAYPDAMQAFVDALSALETVGAVAQRVFDRYGFAGEYADVILTTIQSIHDRSTLTRGHLIRLIERGIDEGSEHDVVTGTGVDSVTVQTIHAAKGLEYPIVILANMNDGKFPPQGGGAPVIRFDEAVGLRQRKVYADIEAYPHVYDNWTHDILRHCLPRPYDEERRLLYVAITRAEQHVVFASGETPNTFWAELPFDERSIDPDVTRVEPDETVQTQLPFRIVSPAGPAGETPHTIMDSDVFADDAVHAEPTETMGEPAFRGRSFGARVHAFAEDYMLGHEVTPSADDEYNVRDFIDGLDGDLHVEQQAVLPLDVDGNQVTISGVVDLVHETPTSVEVVDFKTDTTRRAKSEYRTQLSIYYHVLAECFPEKEVTASIYYTHFDERDEIEPLTRGELAAVVRDAD